MKTLFRILLLLLLAPIAAFYLLLALDQHGQQTAAATPHHEKVYPDDYVTGPPAPCQYGLEKLPRDEQILLGGHVCTNR